MAIDRTTILLGPCIIQFGGATFYAKDAVKAVTQFETFDISTSAHGKVDERVKEIKTEITFTPGGEWDAAALSVLWPITNPVVGTSLLGASDVPVVIHPLNGKEKITYAAGYISKWPDIELSSVKTPIGSVTITCVGKNNTDWSAADKRDTIADAAFSDSSWSTSNVKTVVYTAAIAGQSAPWNAIKLKDGAKISFALKAKEIMTDDDGIVDVILQGLDISVKFAPVNPTLAQVMTLLKRQGSGVARGMSMAASAANITFTGAGSGSPLVTVNSVALKRAPHGYGFDDLRHGELEFVATRLTGSGTMFSVGSVA